MKKVIFFDIDGTLFDVSVFLNLFYEKLSESFSLNKKDIEKVSELYEKTKKEAGYFLPSLFLNKISAEFPLLNKDHLDKIFESIDLFEKSLYKDTLALKDLANIAVLGIFSKGNLDFQKKKLSFLDISIKDKNIYVFSNKIDKASEVFEKYGDFVVYLVDNDLEVLDQIKNLTKVNLILIDRNNNYNSTNIKRIKSLYELKEII